MSSHTTKIKLPQFTGRGKSSFFRTTSALVHDSLVSPILLRSNFLLSLCLTRLSSLKIRMMFCSHKFSVPVRICYTINSNERMNEWTNKLYHSFRHQSDSPIRSQTHLWDHAQLNTCLKSLWFRNYHPQRTEDRYQHKLCLQAVTVIRANARVFSQTFCLLLLCW